MNKEMLFSEVDDCDICPFNVNNADRYGSEFSCNGSCDCSHPCEFMEDYEGMTIEEVVAKENERIYKAEAYAEKIWLAKQAKKEHNAEMARKRQQTRLENLCINKEITRLRRVIRKREEAIDSLYSLQNAVAFTNAMMEGREMKKVEECEQIKAWRLANEGDKKKLAELLKERERRNRERRNIKR